MLGKVKVTAPAGAGELIVTKLVVPNTNWLVKLVTAKLAAEVTAGENVPVTVTFPGKVTSCPVRPMFMPVALVAPTLIAAAPPASSPRAVAPVVAMVRAPEPVMVAPTVKAGRVRPVVVTAR